MEGITLDNLGEKALDKDGKPTKLGLFLSALAMNLEGTDSFIKANTDVDLQAYTKDKVPSHIFMPAFAEWIAQDSTQRAVKAMQNVLNNKVSANDLDAIKAFVDEGDMGTCNPLGALVELTNMMSAIENGTELTTSIGLGSDGINNGIALGSIYNGVANTRTMLQTGLFLKIVNLKLSRNSFQIEVLVITMKPMLKYYLKQWVTYSMTQYSLLNYKRKDIGEEANAIQEIQPAFNVVKFPKPARKLAKAIIIPFGYSAGNARLVQVAQETFLLVISKNNLLT